MRLVRTSRIALILGLRGRSRIAKLLYNKNVSQSKSQGKEKKEKEKNKFSLSHRTMSETQQLDTFLERVGGSRVHNVSYQTKE
jgi:hypothetical protein